MSNPMPPHGIFESADSQTISLTKGLVIGGTLVVLILLLLFAYFSWRHSRRARPELRANPWDVLRKSLEPNLDQSDKDRMGVLNQVLRQSLELRTKQPFTAWTSSEIIRELKGNEQFSSDFQAQCAEFLLEADRVLFAQGSWDPLQRDRDERQIAVWLERLHLGQSL